MIPPPVHLSPPHGTPNGPGATLRAYPMSDPRRLGCGFANVGEVIDYLDVEHSQRYQPVGRDTWCNIALCDLAFLCGLYVPRVWWDDRALARIAAGEDVPVRYPAFSHGVEVPNSGTVREMNANDLCDWAPAWGPNYGWTIREATPENEAEAQAAVDATGLPGFVVARSPHIGHISGIVPSMLLGGPVQPGLVQTQAGAVNRKLFRANWWKSSNFDRRYFGFIAPAQVIPETAFAPLSIGA